MLCTLVMFWAFLAVVMPPAGRGHSVLLSVELFKIFQSNRPAAPLCVIEEVKRPSDLEEKKSRVVFSSCRVISFSSCEFMERGSLPTVCSACGLSSYLSINKKLQLTSVSTDLQRKGLQGCVFKEIKYV